MSRPLLQGREADKPRGPPVKNHAALFLFRECPIQAAFGLSG